MRGNRYGTSEPANEKRARRKPATVACATNFGYSVLTIFAARAISAPPGLREESRELNSSFRLLRQSLRGGQW